LETTGILLWLKRCAGMSPSEVLKEIENLVCGEEAELVFLQQGNGRLQQRILRTKSIFYAMPMKETRCI
jgi:hypothetical protein